MTTMMKHECMMIHKTICLATNVSWTTREHNVQHCSTMFNIVAQCSPLIVTSSAHSTDGTTVACKAPTIYTRAYLTSTVSATLASLLFLNTCTAITY